MFLILIVSCQNKTVRIYKGNSPITTSYEKWRSIKPEMKSPRDLQNPGKIYMFKKAESSPPYFRVPLAASRIDGDTITIGDIEIEPYLQDHGVSGNSLGFIFNQRFAYSTDVAEMDPTSAQMHNSRLFTGPIPPGMLVGIRSCANQAAADQVSYF